MTTSTKEDLTIIAARYIESAEKLVQLAVEQVALGKEEVEILIADLEERLDDEDLSMTNRERALLDATIGKLEGHSTTLWRMGRA